MERENQPSDEEIKDDDDDDDNNNNINKYNYSNSINFNTG